MPFIRINATDLYYELYEEAESAPPVTLVLMHGVGGNHASWFHQVAAWRERYRLLLVDARGFGNSIDAEGAGRDRFLADLEAVLDAADVGKAVLIAQSMSGATAVSYTCRDPGRVAGLVLADTLLGITLPEALRERMDRLTARNAALTQVERVLGTTCVRTNPAMATLYVALASFNRTTIKSLSGSQPLHSPDDIAATGVPTLFLVGEEDVLFPPSEVRAAQKLVAGSVIVELPASGHSAYFETPVAFNDAVENWMIDQDILPGTQHE